MEVTLSGRVTVVSPVQFLKADEDKVSMELPSTNWVSELQF